MRARLYVLVIAVLTISANLWFGVAPTVAVVAGVAVLVLGEVAGRLLPPHPLSVAGASTPQPSPAESHPLSPRELEVAILIAQGLTSKEVGRSLVIEKGTVDKHLEHIKNKLGINSRPQLAIWLMERGLLRPPNTPK